MKEIKNTWLSGLTLLEKNDVGGLTGYQLNFSEAGGSILRPPRIYKTTLNNNDGFISFQRPANLGGGFLRIPITAMMVPAKSNPNLENWIHYSTSMVDLNDHSATRIDYTGISYEINGLTLIVKLYSAGAPLPIAHKFG